MWKTKFLWTFSDGLFRTPSDRISPHPHCQGILQLTSCQIWDFLASCWGYLLPLWLEICVQNNKSSLSGVNHSVKLPAQFWMILSPNKWRCKIFFLFWLRHCDSCYQIQFSNLKNKQTNKKNKTKKETHHYY